MKSLTAESRVTAGLGLAMAAALVSGFAIYLNGQAAAEFSSATLFSTLKNCAVAIFLMSFVAVSGSLKEVPRLPVSSLAGLMAIAVIGGSVPFVLFFEGLARVDSGNAAFLHKTLFLWVAVLAVVLLRERLGPAQFAALAVLLVAHFLIGGPGALQPGYGEAMVLAAALFWAGETVLARHLLPQMSSSLAATARMAGGSVILLAYLAATGRLDLIAQLSMSQWAWIAVTGVVLLTYVSVWYGALKRAPASLVTAVLTVGAPMTAALNVVLDGKPLPSSDQLAGYGLLLTTIASLIAFAVLFEGRRGRTGEAVELARGQA